jgi:alcohol dehydrogenase class IV
MDAITQLIEAFVCKRANPVVDALCLDGLQRAANSLRRAYAGPEDAGARMNMSYAALLSGIALANAGLGAVHGFAGPLGGMFDAPHGAICAALLPHVMAANITALREPARDPTASGVLARYEQIARILTGNSNASPEAGPACLAQLTSELRIRPLSAYGMKPEHAREAAEKAARANSMRANPVALTHSELEAIFQAAL